MITTEQYFGELSLTSTPDQETKDNAAELLERVNALLAEIDLPEAEQPHVNSGWRPDWYNKITPHAAPNSKHMTGQAVDVGDPDGALDNYLFAHTELLQKHGLWMEHPLSTKGWCHLQCVPPRSGNLVFYP